MTYWLRKIRGRFQWLSGRPQRTVDQSRLMEMYLSQANRPMGSSLLGSGTRERQDGRFSQIRRRG
jgi:hypothetical protein